MHVPAQPRAHPRVALADRVRPEPRAAVGQREKIRARRRASTPRSARCRRSAAGRRAAGRASVASRVIRRCWWVLVSFSQVCVPRWAMLVRTRARRRAKSIRSQRSAHSSPRRAPVVIASQTSMPQSGSCQASATIARPARRSAAGVGLRGARSAPACSNGLRPTQPQRTARLPAPFRMAWILRREPGPGAGTACGPHRSSHRARAAVRCSMNAPAVAVRPAGAELLVERVQDLAVDPADLELADQRADVVLDERSRSCRAWSARRPASQGAVPTLS